MENNIYDLENLPRTQDIKQSSQRFRFGETGVSSCEISTDSKGKVKASVKVYNDNPDEAVKTAVKWMNHLIRHYKIKGEHELI